MQKIINRLLAAQRSGSPVYLIRECRMWKCMVNRIDVSSGTGDGEPLQIHADLTDVTNPLRHLPVEDITEILFDND